VDPLAADKEVERAITSCCRPKCHPDVSAAIIELGAALESDASNTRERVLFARLRRTVDMALNSYRSELIARGHVRSRCAFLHFSIYLRRFGRQHTESRLLGMHRLLRRIRSVDDAMVPAKIKHDLVETLDTIDTLRSLVNAVMNFRPKATFIQGVNLRLDNWEQVCRFCDQPTELQAFREGDDSAIREGVPGGHSVRRSAASIYLDEKMGQTLASTGDGLEMRPFFNAKFRN
jgi:hypothetical protein